MHACVNTDSIYVIGMWTMWVTIFEKIFKSRVCLLWQCLWGHLVVWPVQPDLASWCHWHAWLAFCWLVGRGKQWEIKIHKKYLHTFLRTKLCVWRKRNLFSMQHSTLRSRASIALIYRFSLTFFSRTLCTIFFSEGKKSTVKYSYSVCCAVLYCVRRVLHACALSVAFWRWNTFLDHCVNCDRLGMDSFHTLFWNICLSCSYSCTEMLVCR